MIMSKQHERGKNDSDAWGRYYCPRERVVIYNKIGLKVEHGVVEGRLLHYLRNISLQVNHENRGDGEKKPLRWQCNNTISNQIPVTRGMGIPNQTESQRQVQYHVSGSNPLHPWYLCAL